MTETVREVSRFERVVTVELTDAEIDSAKAGAARRLAKDLKIPGFRPGKAPRPVVEAAIGAGRLRTEAIEDLIPKKLGEILTETNLAPAVTPTLEKVDDIEGGVNAEVRVTLWPELDATPDYKDRAVEVEAPELIGIRSGSQPRPDASAVRQPRDRRARPPTMATSFPSTSAPSPRVRRSKKPTPPNFCTRSGSGIMIDGIDDQLAGQQRR